MNNARMTSVGAALAVALTGLCSPARAAGTQTDPPAAAGQLVNAKTENRVEVEDLNLKTGYRALSLPLPANRLVNVKPGDRVDVMVTFEWRVGEKAKEKELLTATLLQNVLVLKTAAFDKETGTIEIEVNPNEAQYAVLAMQPGYSLWLSVRAPGDREMHPMEMASFQKLFR